MVAIGRFCLDVVLLFENSFVSRRVRVDEALRHLLSSIIPNRVCSVEDIVGMWLISWVVIRTRLVNLIVLSWCPRCRQLLMRLVILICLYVVEVVPPIDVHSLPAWD